MIPATADKRFQKALSKRKIKLPTVIAIVVFLIASLFLINRYVGRHVGDIRPALLPASKNIAEIIENQSQRIQTSPAGSMQPQTGEAMQIPLQLPPGFRLSIFAKKLGASRDLEFSPQGTLLVSIPGKGSVLALPDKNGDGKADTVKVILNGLNKPHGVAFYEGKLFVAEETQVVRYNWDDATLTATRDKVLFQLPRGGNHVTRSLVFNKRGQLFVSLGSTCNVCYEKQEWLAAVITSNKDGENPRLFARGLRNSVFLAVNPNTDKVWAGDMGRDFLGDDLPPEEINIIRDGKNYGWPICYGNKIHDTNFDKNTYLRDPCADTEAPIFEYQAHAAPLGLTFVASPQFPKDWQGDLLVAYHGSWNRSTPSGYKVVRLVVKGNAITGSEDFLTGFLQGNEALGRPVDVIFDKQGSLYVSDDKAGVIYKIIRR